MPISLILACLPQSWPSKPARTDQASVLLLVPQLSSYLEGCGGSNQVDQLYCFLLVGDALVWNLGALDVRQHHVEGLMAGREAGRQRRDRSKGTVEKPKEG